MLTPKSKQQLKARAHNLKPIVTIGNNGLTTAVINEVNRALNDHELIKVRIVGQDREVRREILTAVCETTQAEAVNLIGSIGILYRKKDDS